MLYTRNLKQALNYGLVLKKVHILSKFNQNPWLKSYIDRKKARSKKESTDLRKKVTLVAERKRNFLVSELYYHTTKFFTENLLAKDTKKKKKKKCRYL